MVIETERLILREYTLDDFNALFEIEIGRASCRERV